MSSSTALDALTLPFGGSSLIEASAGTGKTYTISGLYLRLLLGHGTLQALTCEQILVVTFTNAATEELRDRIRRRIQLAFRCFIGLEVDDPFILALYGQIAKDQRPMALKRLDLALKSLDEASIFTIHGFCQRILADMAFESSLLFESEFTLDDSEFLHHAVRDFWREACYRLPEFLAQLIQQKFGDPDTLARQLRPLLGASQAIATPEPEGFDELAETLTQSLSRLRLTWPRERERTEALLHSLPLNGVRFGKKADNFPKLAIMLDALDNWARSQQGLPPLKVLECLALSTLRLNKGGIAPTPQEAPVLEHIERLSESLDEIAPAFLFQARAGISRRFSKQKQDKNLLTPDDLLTTLEAALQANPQSLSGSIARRFPVALIDEFQDTDPLQFSIFSGIYREALAAEGLSLLMIGDPKQAIYAFRGADIDTYIQAREQTQDHYNLDTNYRSSSNMIAGVNRLFSQHDDPFISQQIPFDEVKASPFADKKRLIDDNGQPHALQLRLLGEDDDQGLNKATARKLLADDAAAEIKRLLTDAQEASCHIDGKPLVAKNIAILVRDRNEAAVMKEALGRRNIGAVFLSRDSVFSTLEARELALVLIALANPKDERALRSAMATSLLGFNARQIHAFNQDEEVRQKLLEQFLDLNSIWIRRGIMPALLNLARDCRLIERLLGGDDGERRLTDFRHLAELLQHKATELDGCAALLNWYEQALIDNNAGEEGQLRLESEQNLVQIVTIHKSKGLEYPVCFVPFVSLARDSRRRPSPMLYHDKHRLMWDIMQTDEGWERQKRETLAEDLRLLYVALTRPVYRCYLYIANHSRFTKKAGITSQLHETGIGYLLGIDDKACDFALIQAKAQPLACDAISILALESNSDESRYEAAAPSALRLTPKALKRAIGTPWRVGSYSGLVKNLAHEKTAPGADDEVFNEIVEIKDEVGQELSRFSFERGANAGSFMHWVLELIDFTDAAAGLDEHLPEAMKKYGIEESWQPMLKTWYLDLLCAPLASGVSEVHALSALEPGKQPLSLSMLKPSQKLVEMEFYLPIASLNADALNALLAQHGYSSGLQFDALKGMLKGFIDLTFEFEGKFYIADYKSNHLGDDPSHYGQEAMTKAMKSHRYDLQYLLYTLALHRYLRLRLPNYQYRRHIGGSFYLFLRGMSVRHPGAGVYYDLPSQALIEALDSLLESSVQVNATQQEMPL